LGQVFKREKRKSQEQAAPGGDRGKPTPNKKKRIKTASQENNDETGIVNKEEISVRLAGIGKGTPEGTRMHTEGPRSIHERLEGNVEWEEKKSKTDCKKKTLEKKKKLSPQEAVMGPLLRLKKKRQARYQKGGRIDGIRKNAPTRGGVITLKHWERRPDMKRGSFCTLAVVKPGGRRKSLNDRNFWWGHRRKKKEVGGASQ